MHPMALGRTRSTDTVYTMLPTLHEAVTVRINVTTATALCTDGRSIITLMTPRTLGKKQLPYL